MKLFTLFILSALFSTCSNNSEKMVLSNLMGQEFKVISINDNDVSDKNITLVLQDDKKINGFGGCNKYFGNYSIDGEKIVFSKVSATKMHCADTSIKKNEQLLLKLLPTIKKYSATDKKTIALLDKSDQSKIVLEL